MHWVVPMEHTNDLLEHTVTGSVPGIAFEWNATLDARRRRLAVRFALNTPARVHLTLSPALCEAGKVLFDAPRSAGSFAESWDMVDSLGRTLVPGMYLVTLTLDGEPMGVAMVIRS